MEVIDALHDRIDSVNPSVNALVTMAPDARERAVAAERAASSGADLGPLHGVPFTVKDCIDTAGLATTRGSQLFAERVPEADATVVARMQSAGGILLGKTNMPEFALDGETNNPLFGRTNNPWCLERSPGGSSGGEAAAIASGMSPIGIGTDVGGSIRLPASFCGITGLKPTHGRVPLTGQWPELLLKAAHVGPMARSTRDIALAMSVISGADGIDPFASNIKPPGSPQFDRTLSGLKIGWSSSSGFAPVDGQAQRAVEEAADLLSGLGARLEATDMGPLSERDFREDHLTAFCFEAVPYVEKIVGDREAAIAPSTAGLLQVGRIPREVHLEVRRRITHLRQWTGESLRRYDALLVPTSPMPAFRHGQSGDPIGGRKVHVYHALRTTSPWNYTGSPAASVPFGWTDDGLPLGVQIVGRRLEDATVLSIAEALESGAPDRDRKPMIAPSQQGG